MKTTLYASLSANGFFGQAAEEREIQADVLADFVDHVRETGNVTIGRRTFELMLSSGSGGAFGDVDIIVLSGRQGDHPGASVASSPLHAVRVLEDKGHPAVLVAGGAATNNSFLASGLVDEIYLNTLPLLTGKGLNVTLPNQTSAHLRLLDVRRLGDNTVQSHYRVAR